MKRIVLWGAAGRAEKFFSLKCFWKNSSIVGVVDNNITGTFHSHIIHKPQDLTQMSFDILVICSQYVNEILSECDELFLNGNVEILIFDELYTSLHSNIIKKYRDLGTEEYKWVSFFNNHELSVWGPYEKKHTENQVYYENGHPFIFIGDEKLFYPDDYIFVEKNGKQYIYDVLSEQYEDSPHLYIREPQKIINGCIVDAGTCEGNFAIRYAKNASKIYLIESDPRWIEPLQRSFAPYKEKTIICNKKLGRYTNDDSICLDDLLDCQIDFLKMDIEGAEIDALLGGRKVLTKSSAECAIASYHRYKDEENIKFLMSAMGYDVSTSKGYMLFLYDEDISYTLDIRRGIVYCDKQK